MKIHELEDLLGVSRATIRHYEDQGLITPIRAENSYRDYSDEDVRLLQKIIVMRKLDVSIPEIKDLIDGKADLHDVLERNEERLRTQKRELNSSIEMCGEINRDSADFSDIDSAKYLKHIYEEEQKGAHFADPKEINVRQLNLAITLLGAFVGMPIPQNKLYSDRSNEPLSDDIRGNKTEGDEHATIGQILKNGGKLKAVLIAVLVLIIVLAILQGLSIWGGFFSVFQDGIDSNTSSQLSSLPSCLSSSSGLYFSSASM